jgi:hypothetical protein
MRWMRKSAIVATGILLAASLSNAQIPGVPGPPPGAIPAGFPGATPPAAPDAKLGFFGKMCAGLQACRAKLCQSPAGQMLNNATKPLSAMTGGIMPGFCPIMPSAADLAQPGVAGASDAIKKDALEAKMRQEKVRFLGTVDCRYYPDAIGALTAALRTDGSECVRHEAALALGHGCCCNQKTIDALDASVSGTEKDGNPAERSTRVRCAAAIALERCLACYVPQPVEVDETPKVDNPEIAPPPFETPLKKSSDTTSGTAKTGTPTAAKKLAPDQRMPSRRSVETAWKTLNEFNALLAAARPQVQAAAAAPAGDRYSVYQIIKNSAATPNEAVQTASAPQPAPPVPPTLPARMPVVSMISSAEPARFPSAFQPTALSTNTPPLVPSSAVQPPVAPALLPASAVQPPATPALVPQSLLQPTATPALVPPSILQPTATPALVPPSVVQPTTTQVNPVVPVLAQVLHGATAAERHAAIRQLVKFDWHENPIIVSGLLAGAKQDSVAAVRVDCMRHLAGYHMVHPQVIADLTAIAQDSDPWVREEATKALAQLQPNP